jgi:hypothetical protein
MSGSRRSKPKEGTLYRVSEGLYRSPASGTYFAQVRIHGKLFRESLQTKDLALAKRKLSDFRRSKKQVDPGAGRFSLAQLCERYLQTIQYLSESSIQAKTGITRRVTDEWPGGPHQLVGAIRYSDCQSWLARQASRVGKSHYNAYVQTLRELFDLAVRDRIVADNPAADIHYVTREKPLRESPSWEQFQNLVTDIREQKLNADSEASADFIEFLGLSGLGNAEANALTWNDVDWQREKIRVY